jgi:nitroreductase
MKTIIIITKTMFIIFAVFLTLPLAAQSPETIVLDPPDTSRGVPVMTALANRASVRQFNPTLVSHKDLSDLVWAANGINRPGEDKRTAPSALNAQDIDVYVWVESAFYLYNPGRHALDLVVEGDFRDMFALSQDYVKEAPLVFLLVSDISRFSRGDETQRLRNAAMDAAMVAQNILIFCASEGFATVPRGIMDSQKIRELLNLTDSQYPMLNVPVSYAID